MSIELKENERLDEVNESLRIIQRKDGLVFGTDALLLSAYVDRHAARAAELGAGTGIVSLLLLRRQKVDRITAVEVQEDYADITRRNADLNGLTERLQVLCCDLRTLGTEHFDRYDLVVSNPPYMRADGGYLCEVTHKSIARHELNGGIRDFCIGAARLTRYGGYAAFVYRPDRLCELIAALSEAGLEPKRMTLVHADATAAPSMVLVLCKRGAAPGLTVSRPLLLHTDPSHTHPSPDMQYILDHGTFPAAFFGTPDKRKVST